MRAADNESYKLLGDAWKQGRAVYRDTGTGDFHFEAGPTRVPVPRPRIGLYRSHVPAMDEGWTRWLLDTYGWPFRPVTNEEIRRGGLNAAYDVILFPDQSPDSIHNGYRRGSMPDPYTGGLGEDGAAALGAFAEAGGTLLFLNRAANYGLAALSLPARNVLNGVSNRDFYCPGSLLNVELRAGHPLGYGLPASFPIWMESSPAWEADGGVASYPAADILASGWLLGERYLPGKSALLDVPVGRGRAILFGFRPQYRAQSYQTFKLLFNALLYR
jgi:hypothetical protein